MLDDVKKSVQDCSPMCPTVTCLSHGARIDCFTHAYVLCDLYPDRPSDDDPIWQDRIPIT